MPEKIRTFIAVELDQAQHRVLRDVQERFKRAPAASFIHWVAPDSIHMTLKFLGDVDATAMAALQSAVAEACVEVVPFALNLKGAGAFPNTKRPNVVWVGLDGQVERAVLLAQRLDDACAVIGMPRQDRPFSPHLTLGRVKRDARPSERQMVGELIDRSAIGELGLLQIDRVSVMKSELRPSGSIYTRLAAEELMRR